MTDTPLTCEFYGCERTDGLHYAFGYGFAGYYCFEHCPNFYLGEGCSHPDEHEAYMTTDTPLTDAVTQAMRSPAPNDDPSLPPALAMINVTLLAYTQFNPSLAEHVIAQGIGTPQENLIEYAGRICYRSDEKMGHNPAFIQLRVREGHEDIIEHVRLVFGVEGQPLDETVLELVNLPTVEFTRTGDQSWVFSMNARNVRDFWQRDRGPMAARMITLAAAVMPSVYSDVALPAMETAS